MNATRRNVMKGALVVNASALFAGTACAREAWDEEFDVVVLGQGGAGGMAAYKAAEAGLRVLVCEAAPEEFAGGDTCCCSGMFGVTTAENLVGYSMGAISEEGAVTLNEAIQEYLDFMAEETSLPYEDGRNQGAGPAVYKACKELVQSMPDLITLWFDTPGKVLVQDSDTREVKGAIVVRDGVEVNLEELAALMVAYDRTIMQDISCDPVGLVAAVEQYNADCAAGADSLFDRNEEYMTPIGEGPYYAIEISPCIMYTIGGIHPDVRSRVIGIDGEAIPRLYAAGNIGRLHGRKNSMVIPASLSGGHCPRAQTIAILIIAMGPVGNEGGVHEGYRKPKGNRMGTRTLSQNARGAQEQRVSKSSTVD